MTASLIMRMTYGITLKESNDLYIQVAEEAAESIIQAGLPGQFAVDFIPIS